MEGWGLGGPALLPGSWVPAPKGKGGREGELLRTLQITAALSKRCQLHIPSQANPLNTNSCLALLPPSKQSSWLVGQGGQVVPMGLRDGPQQLPSP